MTTPCRKCGSLDFGSRGEGKRFCRTCANAGVRAWRERNPDWQREYRERTQARREAIAAGVKPCRKCGGIEFTLKNDPRLKRGMTRYCLPCQRKRDLAWRARNLEERRRRDREGAKRRRVAKILAEMDEQRRRAS